ncbi:hypothetical protein PAESOLCIP111_02108 [Paenibacillus solanacearum]|uniref:GH26 domain-containing protein n=1 Tax=Paenibacillus solanacearum TaxID=2048548 RepID=A0A916JZE2_9BACL|nr:glycosyl hydrolase [Paenibacillus solanacearum]CAG7618367.1 hypothetical protein PAESOLCIP111_02108 [Paenibacillus solanacearum]
MTGSKLSKRLVLWICTVVCLTIVVIVFLLLQNAKTPAHVMIKGRMIQLVETIGNAWGAAAARHASRNPEGIDAEASTGKTGEANKRSEEALAVLDYVQSMSGKKILSGQSDERGASNGQTTLAYVEKVTGKSPAILGLDVGMYDARHSTAYFRKLNNVIKDAKAYWDQNGIVSLQWHWSNPLLAQASYENTKAPFNLEKALSPGTAEYKAIMQDLEVIAEALGKLQSARVPVLWRPLHEADGQWFWWGKGTPEQYKQLWIYIHNYLSKEKGLNNLIWIYSASLKLNDAWYPGDAYVDIVGTDLYYKNDTPNDIYSKAKYDGLVKLGGGRPVALTENGVIPDPQKLLDKGFLWSWFLTWHTTYLKDNNTDDDLRRFYHHDLVITREELPSFSRKR